MAPLQVDVSVRQILKIALPISLALMVPQFNFIINNVFLGHLSEQALAAASITGVYYLIFAGIGYGLNNGLQALISRRAGENRPNEIGRIFDQGIMLSIMIAAAGIAITYLFAPLILRWSIRSAETYTMSVEFLRIRIWGLPFLYVYQMRNALLVGTNNSKYLIAGTLAEAVANVFFDYTLIFGRWGLPALGFTGAAYASVIAEFFGMFVIYLVIATKDIGKRFSLLKHFKWDAVYAKLILKMSGPLVLQHAFALISWIFFYILVEHHGKTSLAISNTMRNVFGFFGVFNWAFASTANMMVSNVIGQGKSDEVFGLLKKIITLSGGFAAAVCVLLNMFPHTYLSIFGQSQTFIDTAIPVLRIVACSMILMAAGTVMLNAVTGTGNPKKTFHIELIAILFYSIYVYIVLEELQLSIFWGWMSEILYWLIIFSCSLLYLRSGRWKNKKV
jgi:putative MATE family efflux protein